MNEKDYMFPSNWDTKTWKELAKGGLILAGYAVMAYVTLWIVY